MKFFFIITLLITSVNISFAQVTIEYDKAGNQVKRYSIDLSDKSAKESNEDIPSEYLFDGNTSLLIYPNPTEDILFVSIKDPEDFDSMKNSIEIHLYTSTGNLLLNEVYTSNSFYLDISDKPDGIYLLDVSISGKKKLFNIVKE